MGVESISAAKSSQAQLSATLKVSKGQQDQQAKVVSTIIESATSPSPSALAPGVGGKINAIA